MALYFVIVNVIGVSGYMFFEGWSFHDALYMTVITLTAVGYHEVAPLSATGRNFTMGLLALGLTGLGLWFAAITAFFVEMDLTGTLQRRRNMKTIAKLRNHVIVCGCGRTGMQVLIELEQSELDFVVVEVDAERIRSVRSRFPNALVVEGDAAKDETLESAGIRHARGLITCLSEDADNLFVCLSARVLNAELTVVARADDPETTAKMYRAGAKSCRQPQRQRRRHDGRDAGSPVGDDAARDRQPPAGTESAHGPGRPERAVRRRWARRSTPRTFASRWSWLPSCAEPIRSRSRSIRRGAPRSRWGTSWWSWERPGNCSNWGAGRRVEGVGAAVDARVRAAILKEAARRSRRQTGPAVGRPQLARVCPIPRRGVRSIRSS